MVGTLGFLILIYFPIFLHLDYLPLDNFDEARLAVSALEMHENGNWLIPHFGGKPDMWSTKPPLMIWAQVICIKIFGVNELAIRLPSALAALFTVLLLIWFSKKYLSTPLVGIFASLILITTNGFIVKHVSRTGDYDSLLVFFMTIQALFFWLFIESENNSKKKNYILLFGLSIVCSVLTKSVVGLMFLPALFIYALIQKKLRNVFLFKWTWFAILGSLALILGYYFIREHYNPGYFQAVWENELGGRYLKTVEKHKAPFGWYFERLISTQFIPWIYILPLAIWVGFKGEPQIKKITLFSILIVVSFLLAISMAGTKLYHYDAPIYPFLAILMGIGFYHFYNKFDASSILKVVIFILIFAYPYCQTIDSIYLKEPHKSTNEYAWFMRRNQDTKEYFVAIKKYNAHLEFYKQAYNRNGYTIEKIYPKSLKIGNTAMFCQNDIKKMIDQHYKYQIKDTNRGCFLVEIISKR
ncbi:MAG: glycosyltransferase family 39 protein [Bacteroidetes bacterium]|nr:glycosyltransferase family 39 protein [Bacteroidota bacterium]MDF1863270.1 glycosyltransferase family 39 protein [Saprospiraceae bacterium]